MRTSSSSCTSRLAALAALLTVACVGGDPPPPPEEQPEPAERFELEQTPVAITITGPSYRAELQASAGWTLASLRTAGEGAPNLLATGTSELEEMAGVLLFPTWSSGTAATATAEVLEAGDALARVRVQWDGGDGPDAGLSGTTTWTFHRDGRIVRSEQMMVRATAPGAWLVAYVALDAARFSSVRWSASGGTETGEQALSSSLSVEHEPIFTGNGDGWSCAEGTPAVGWAQHGAIGDENTGCRATQTVPTPPGPPTTVALQSDFGRAHVDAGWYQGDFATVVGPDCDAVKRMLTDYVAAPLPQVVAGTLSTSEPGDEDQDGFSEAGGYYSVTADGGEVELWFPGNQTPTSATLRVQRLALGVVAVFADDEELEAGVDFVIQPIPAGGYWVAITAIPDGTTAIRVVGQPVG